MNIRFPVKAAVGRLQRSWTEALGVASSQTNCWGRFLLGVTLAATLAACGGGGVDGAGNGPGGGTTRPPGANSSGAAVTLKPGVVSLDATSGVTQVGDLSFEATPPNGALQPGAVFTLDDRAFVVTNTTTTGSVHSIIARLAERDEVIERIEIVGDLDVSAIRTQGIVVRLPARATTNGRQTAQGREQPMAAGDNCKATFASGQLSASCTLAETLLNGKVSYEGTVKVSNIKVTGVAYNSATAASTIKGSGNASVSMELSLALKAAALELESDEAVLFRLEIPYPGTLGFISVRIPIAADAKINYPPLNFALKVEATLVDWVPGSPRASTTYGLGDGTLADGLSPVNVEGYAHLVSGVELVATVRPVLSIYQILPASDKANVVAGVGGYFKAGPKITARGEFTEFPGKGCWQVQGFTEILAEARAWTDLFSFLGIGSVGATTPLATWPLATGTNLGECIARLRFSPAEISVQASTPVDLRQYLRALDDDGSELALPPDVTFQLSSTTPTGATVGGQSGVFNAPSAGTYVVVATRPSGMTSNTMNVRVGNNNTYAVYIVFQNIPCGTSATGSLTVTGNGQSFSFNETETAPSCGSGLGFGESARRFPIALTSGATYTATFNFTRTDDLRYLFIANVAYEIDAFTSDGQYSLPPPLSFYSAVGDRSPTMSGSHTSTFLAR
jgi:hypothetical protein